MSFSDARTQAIQDHLSLLVTNTSAETFEILQRISGHLDDLNEAERNKFLVSALFAAIDGSTPGQATRALKSWAYEQDEEATDLVMADLLADLRDGR